jgi:hypothetical protein
MGRNGKLFISVISTPDFTASVWDPYVYRHDGESHTLSEFAHIYKVTARNNPYKRSPFQPIEYRDIPGGSYLSFMLRPIQDSATNDNRLPAVSEDKILLGTMRAYLGNIVVTPLAKWLNQEPPVYFSVKSEFALVSPHDRLTYFWLVYMRSKHFLENLPMGTGGTRPRLQPQSLGQTPVRIPPIETRERIHEELEVLARKEWENYSKTLSTIDWVNSLVQGL